MRPKALTAALTCAILALALAACGDDDEPAAAPSGTGPAVEQTGGDQRPVATVAITETEFEISPAEPTADTAGLVRFEVKNDGEIAHALEVEGADGEYETADIAPGETATLDVELPEGSYTIYCPIGNHRDQGMEGTVSIAGGGGAPPEEEPEEEDSGGSDGR